MAAAALAKVTDPRFRVVAFDDYPTAAELDALGDAVLFSWHTFESMYENPELRRVLHGRKVVATTRRNVEYGYAAIGYSADDFEIGERGAQLLHKNFSDPDPDKTLGHHNVGQPTYKCWVHLACYETLAAGWTIPPNVLNGASKFGVAV